MDTEDWISPVGQIFARNVIAAVNVVKNRGEGNTSSVFMSAYDFMRTPYNILI